MSEEKKLSQTSKREGDNANITEFVGDKRPDISESVEEVEGALDSLELENEKIESLIDNSGISKEEKDAFKKELDELKNETLSLKKRFLKKLEAILEPVLGAIGNAIEAYGHRFGADNKKIKGMEFVLDNLDIENKDELVQEFEKTKNKEDGRSLYSVPTPLFPLNEQGREMLTLMSFNNIRYMHELFNAISTANFAYLFVKEGVSIKLLSKIDFHHLGSRASDDPIDTVFLSKLKILDKTDIKVSDTKISKYSIDVLSIEQLTLLIDNPYFKISWENSHGLYTDDLIDILNVDNLKKIKDFAPEIEVIDICSIRDFLKKVSNLSDRVINICKLEYKNGTSIRNLPRFAAGQGDGFIKSLNEDQLSMLEMYLLGDRFDFLYGINIKDYISLNKSIFDRCERLDLDFYDTNISTLKKINNLSNEALDIFIALGNSGAFDERILAAQNIDRIIGKGRLPKFIHILEITNNKSSVMYYAGNDFLLENVKFLLDKADEEKDIDLIDFIFKTYGSDTLRTICFDSFYKDKLLGILSTFKGEGLSIEELLHDYYKNYLNLFKNFDDVNNMLIKKGIILSKTNIENIYLSLLSENWNHDFFLEKNTFPLTEENKREIVNRLLITQPVSIVERFIFFRDNYLDSYADQQSVLDTIFNKVIISDPLMLLNCKEFPFTPEQERYIAVFRRIQESPSKELKNIITEIAPLIGKYTNPEEADDALSKIEQIFLTNNIPFIGKQYKVFEVLYKDKELSYAIGRSKVESFKDLKEPSKQRLAIFKDLIRIHISSSDKNLEQYLNILKDSRDVLQRFESGESISDEERNKLRLFFKKINVLTGHIGRESISLGDDLSDESLSNQLSMLSKAFGVQEGQGIIDRFERTFLKRIGIDSIEEALEKMNKYKKDAESRNQDEAKDGYIKVRPGDFIKGISSDYLDTYLDRGIYAPEFIGAESVSSKAHSKSSDATPFDTDLSMVEEGKTLKDTFNGYGDIYLIVKNKDQLQEDGLDIFKTGVIADNHYGIRTGFGSTNIDAICANEEGLGRSTMDKIKFFIAQKGFYIAICDPNGKVVFTKEEYDKYRKIFAGNTSLKGPDVEISEVWKVNKNSESIKHMAQTEGNLEKMSGIKRQVIDKIKGLLESKGIKLHQGEYDDSLLGAVITDTGSTGRGSALDEKYDFDFAVKLDDDKWDKVPELMKGLEDIFLKADSYENKGMIMFRSDDIEIDGHIMTIDVGFNKKSDSESFDAHDALNEKYKSIEKMSGRQSLLDVLTNIRFAKKKLKEAGCYKKGVGGDGQQGGLGGIGVEYWIIQNGGDSIKAFRDFANNAYDNGQLISFDDFKKKYKIFSAGQNIRGNLKVENFTHNMTEDGYKKMAALSLELTQ